MRRRTAIALLIGWLLGIGTSLVVPDLIVQRRTILSDQMEEYTRDGWYVIRRDAGVWTVERPRLRLP